VTSKFPQIRARSRAIADREPVYRCSHRFVKDSQSQDDFALVVAEAVAFVDQLMAAPPAGAAWNRQALAAPTVSRSEPLAAATVPLPSWWCPPRLP
jgi:hypothetical protein